MSTPICDFVKEYAAKNSVRMHMPGHKGCAVTGAETLDITEIDGADELFSPDGIIAQSEAQTSAVFGCSTFYSASGSTLCIQAMLLLICRYAQKNGQKPRILAVRNAHKAFVNAAAVLGIDVIWINPSKSHLSCRVTARDVAECIKNTDGEITAVYITSPDYLGIITDIKQVSAVCRAHNILLAVDCAHGAYLKFLPESLFPTDLGADICCSSAHKTLPVLTGGAYLHISDAAPQMFESSAKDAMAFFASSSPSYLVLQSLDMFSECAADFKSRLADFLPAVQSLKNEIAAHGFSLCGDEPLKITAAPKSFGYTGTSLAKILTENGIFPEFYDADFTVLMPSPYNSPSDTERVARTLCKIRRAQPITDLPPEIPEANPALPPKAALMRGVREVDVRESLGKICAETNISCPPAVPIAVLGDRITEQTVKCFEYYGIRKCKVIDE